MANNKISPLAALNRPEGGKRGVSSLKGYGQPSTVGEFLGGFTGAPRRFSVMDPEASGMQTARDVGEQASVAGQMFGAMTPFAASAAAAKAGQMMGVSPLTVYHGSPHRFSKFDASKIGTGEGAQAYGRGLYFAESPGVAEGYARNLANRDLANQGRLNAHANAQRLANLAGDPKYAANDIRFVLSNEPDHPQKKLLQDTLVFLESGDFAKPLQNKGSLYTVDLPDEKIAKMLDWDKPFSQQSSYVQDALRKLPQDVKNYIGIGKYEDLKGGTDILKPLGGLVGDAKASEMLRQAGIPGIRYLDEGSRAAGKGTSNFVVFPGEEEALTILDVKKKGGAVTRRGALSLANGGSASSEVPDTYYPPEDIQRELQVLLNRPQEPRQADFFGRSAPQGIQRRGEPVVNPFRFLQEAGRGALGMEPQMQRGSAAYRAGQALSAGPGAAATLPGKLAGSGADVLAGLGAAAGVIKPKINRKVDLTGALKPNEPVHRGETSKELLKAQKKQLSDQEKENLEGFRQTYPEFSNAVKFMTPQEVSKIIRNPEGVAEMNRLLQVIPSSRELAAVAKAGAPKQGWYRASTQALIDVFGVQDAPRFAALLAAMSPQTSVESNLINTLNTWKNWTAAGRPTDPREIKAIMGISVQGTGTEASVLDAWTNNSIRALRAQDPTKVTLSGPKVDSFYRNLADDVYRVTNDAWMASGLGVNQNMFSGSPTELQLMRGDPGFSPGYLASSARIRDAGQSANMLPLEAQETLWSFFMPLYEMQRSTGLPAREILQRGLLTPESIRGTPDFSTLLTQGQYGDVLRNAGYEQQLSAIKPYRWPENVSNLSLSEQREVERAAQRLERLKDLREKESRAKVFLMPEGKSERGFASAQIEYVPGEGTGILPDMINAPMGTRQHFSSRMAGAFKNPQERDILQMALGLEPVATRSMTGSFRPSGTIGFQGNVKEQAREVPKAWETNPGFASLVEVPLTKKGDIPKSYKDRLAAAEALRGYITGQRGSTYNLQVPDEKGPGMVIPLEKKADPEAMRFAASMTDEDVFLADTGRGVNVIFNPYKEGNQPLGGLERKFLTDVFGGQRYVPTRNISDYIDYSEALTGPEGTGAATRLLGERLSPLSQAQQTRLSEASQPVAGDVLDIMTKAHERAERPMRADYARALELIKRGGIPALMAALAAGDALPAELVNDLLNERQTQKNTPEIE